MSTATATPTWPQVDDIPTDYTEADVIAWSESEHRKGVAEASRRLTKGHNRLASLPGRSLPFQYGYLLAEATEALNAYHGDDGSVRDVLLDTHAQYMMDCATRAVLDRLVRRAEAYAEADKLTADAAKASMAPVGVGLRESDELDQALGVLSAFGQFDDAGAFHPFIVRRHEQDGARMQETPKGKLPLAQVMPKVYKALNDKVAAGHTVARVDLAFTDPTYYSRARGEFFNAEPGTPQIVFLSMTEGSAAYGRGEHVWACWFTPPTRNEKDRATGWNICADTGYPVDPETGFPCSTSRRDPDTGRPLPVPGAERAVGFVQRSVWYSPVRPFDGYGNPTPIAWGGVIATFPSYEDGVQAAADLRRALAAIRRIDAERDRAERPDDAVFTDEEPQVTRSWSPEPVL